MLEREDLEQPSTPTTLLDKVADGDAGVDFLVEGTWLRTSWAELRHDSADIADRLVASGLGPGRRSLIVARTGPEVLRALLAT